MEVTEKSSSTTTNQEPIIQMRDTMASVAIPEVQEDDSQSTINDQNTSVKDLNANQYLEVKAVEFQDQETATKTDPSNTAQMDNTSELFQDQTKDQNISVIQLLSPPTSGQEAAYENDDIKDFVIFDAIENSNDGPTAKQAQMLQATPDFK